jgi:nicotinamidase-related amidase
MWIDTLFDQLDLNRDGAISRSELRIAAKQLGWHWNEAPLFAFLDLFSILQPIPKRQFTAYMQEIMEDHMGVYGQVLLKSPHFQANIQSEDDRPARNAMTPDKDGIKRPPQATGHDDIPEDLISLLKQFAGVQVEKVYHRLLNTLDSAHLSKDETALLILDPQKSFTTGVWMQSIGKQARTDVAPIMLAFKNCTKLLSRQTAKIETMFTRCPFPPESYDWDDRLAGVLDTQQLYFIKPGNSVLFPPTNGFKAWVKGCIDSGKKNLVIGGCTLNSCVRVSAIETRQYFGEMQLQVVVDMSLSGARTRNYHPSAQYEGVSAVESAVRQMQVAGVQVVRQVQWQ